MNDKSLTAINIERAKGRQKACAGHILLIPNISFNVGDTMKEYKFLIGREGRSSEEKIEVKNPYNEEVV
ncbi:MAG: hypothetical protein ACE5J3_11325, partial [Methanosarcinales archaeon]